MNANYEVLKHQILLCNARDEVVDLAAKFTKVASVKEGEYICFQGDAQAPLVFLLEGQLRVSTYSEDGIEIPVSVVHCRECAGEISILNRVPVWANLAAAKDSVVGLLDRAHARQLLNDPDVARALNSLMARRYMGLAASRSARSQSRAGARVSAVIEATIGERVSGDLSLVELPNQSTIAAMAKVSRETVSRVISSLEKRGIVKREGRAIRIRDRAALHLLASA
ncbi:Crp/Fnr family transcriptional regulator [Paraburkholderia tagetis]|uniref:Crp/Fnr family transcriptional regulator n=1 Tax=Paraburkholderia tagetis TaxID=2913261 RepID=A0A9X1RQL0_9BURK|nr:Crp/Fnr family transcriptional regulator [Paraburkholderia tagetis]MCG5074519.1 Crp/Fnr family transcriptional regulator [Paraburkholderia tagetis]